MTTLMLHGCKCGGTLERDRIYPDEQTCIQCGRTYYAQEPLQKPVTAHINRRPTQAQLTALEVLRKLCNQGKANRWVTTRELADVMETDSTQAHGWLYSLHRRGMIESESHGTGFSSWRTWRVL